MAERELTGTLTTDANGIVTFTYPTAQIGKMQVFARFNTGYTINSENYTLYDTIKHDKGMRSNNRSIWEGTTSIIHREYDATRLTAISQSNSIYTSIDVSDDFCIELDVFGVFNTGSALLSLRYLGDYTHPLLSVTRSTFGFANNTWYHVVFKVINGHCVVTANGNTLEGDVHIADSFAVRVANNETLKFKNVKIYSI